MVIIFVQSSFSSIELPKVEFISADKLVHMGVYGFLAILCYISLIHLAKRSTFTDSPFSWSLVIASLYGISDEFHQYFVPNRSSEVQDWLADFVGVVFAVLIIKYFLQNRYKLFMRA